MIDLTNESLERLRSINADLAALLAAYDRLEVESMMDNRMWQRGWEAAIEAAAKAAEDNGAGQTAACIRRLKRKE